MLYDRTYIENRKQVFECSLYKKARTINKLLFCAKVKKLIAQTKAIIFSFFDFTDTDEVNE